MFTLLLARLACASLVMICIAPTAQALADVDTIAIKKPNDDRFASSGHAPNGRYQPEIMLPGSSAHAVNMCIKASEREAERYGRVIGAEVARVDRRVHGFGVFGKLMVKSKESKRAFGVDFICLTQNDRVGSVRLSRD